MKILLISANRVRTPYAIYPLGLDYVAGSLGPSHDVTMIDMNLFKDQTELADAIRGIAPDLVGVSIRNIDNTDIQNTKDFVNQYREIATAVRTASGAPLVLGGAGFTIFPRRLMEELGADYGVIGEGERFPLLVEALMTGSNPGAIPGVITGGSDEAVPPPWDHAPARRFDSGSVYLPFYIAHGGMLNLQTKRGCTYRCVYCTYPHIEGGTLRLVPPDDVAATALNLQASGARYLFITDSVFNSSYEHSRAVAEAFRGRGIAVPWGAFFAPTRPPDGYYTALAAAGCTHVEFGTESISDPVLRAYRKPFTAADVFYAHAAARDAGIHVAHYFLLGGPGETPETLDETLAAAGRLQNTVLFFFCGMRIYPHTALHELAVSEGLIGKDDDILSPVYYHSPHITTDEIIRRVEESAQGRQNWIIGGGADKTRVMARLYRQGYAGPLWEHLIP